MGKHRRPPTRDDTPTPMGTHDEEKGERSELKKLNKRERRERRKSKKHKLATSPTGETSNIQVEIKKMDASDLNEYHSLPDAPESEESEPHAASNSREVEHSELALNDSPWFHALDADTIRPVTPLHVDSVGYIGSFFSKQPSRRGRPLKQRDCYLCKTFNRSCHTVDKSLRDMVLDAGRMKASAQSIRGIAQHITRVTDEMCMAAVAQDYTPNRHRRRQSWSWNPDFASVHQSGEFVFYNPNGCFG